MTGSQCVSSGITQPHDLNLEVAQRRLRESTSPLDAVEAVREIVTNLLGSEQIALFKADEAESTLNLFWSFGIDPETSPTLDISQSIVLQGVMEGDFYLQGAFVGGQNRGPIGGFHTLIPIRVVSQTVGVLAIRSLLPQKEGFDASDVRLLELLSQDAGEALFSGRQVV